MCWPWRDRVPEFGGTARFFASSQIGGETGWFFDRGCRRSVRAVPRTCGVVSEMDGVVVGRGIPLGGGFYHKRGNSRRSHQRTSIHVQAYAVRSSQQSLPAVPGTYAVVRVATFSPVDSAPLRPFIAWAENRELPGTGARPTMDRRTRIG